MFTYHTKIYLKQTDATGVLYFSEQFDIALEAFEEFLHAQNISLNQLIGSPYLMPIIHAEGDYLAPLCTGDELEVRVCLKEMGTKSITIDYQFYKLVDSSSYLCVGKVTLVHVTIDQQTKVSIPIPPYIKSLIECLGYSDGGL